MKYVKGECFNLNSEWVLYDFNDTYAFLDECNASLNKYDYLIAKYYVVPGENKNVLVPGRPCYNVYDSIHPYMDGEYTTYIERIGFVTNIYKYYGDLISFYFWGISLCAGPYPEMVYMKNPEGEYEYLNEEFMPSGIDLLKNSDMKVAAADGHISVSLPDYVQSGMLEVIDLNGRVVATQMMFGNHADVYLKHYAKGMYIVQFRAEGHLAVQKIIL